ncbi:MAG TPA: TIM44-like domain-containing protein [Pseudorhodoplanes sp.]|nr:TIM44-like domain-containing protein [Pseudorhodoplanes sp.]
MFHTNRLRAFVAIAALAGALAFVAAEAVAKPGGGGSRGSRTFSSPAPTATAPGGAKPIERTMTPQTQRPTTTAAAPAAAGAQQGGMFGGRFGGFGGGLMAGLLGAGLVGMLMGGGLFSGLSGAGFAGFLGLLLQAAVIGGIAYFAWTWWQRRQAGAYATANGPSMRDIGDRLGGQTPKAYGGGSGVGAAPAPVTSDITITEDDFNAFERNLGEVQAAYSAEDLGKLRSLVTPEMLGYLAEDLSDNASRGVVNTTSDIKLLQGDLAEAWSEDGREYATVAMRYSLIDVTRERASGKLVEGSETPQETTEYWTFLRSRGGAWILSAIQET